MEEPLEIRLRSSVEGSKTKSISVTMRTPGNDIDLALGFLFTEGIIRNNKEVLSVKSTAGLNIVEVNSAGGVTLDLPRLERNFYTTSSCGVCGKSSLESIRTIRQFPITEDRICISKDVLYSLPGILRTQQSVFEHTGGLHASALFSVDGKLLVIREDVGRHNALDKVIGAKFQLDELPLENHILLLSSRISFELVQKACMAGIKIVAGVGAPSSLAVQMAKEFDIRLAGFLRNRCFNVYCGSKRVVL